MSAPLSRETLAKLKSKRCVFTVTAGRTGTNYAQKLFALFPDTLSLHEPEPNFAHVLRRAQQNHHIANAFCFDTKLPFIAAVREARYVETGHLFCKGFVESFLKAGFVPDLIILRRRPREIARSLWGLDTIPARSALGHIYLLSPEDPGVLPLPQWQYLNDYQLCFWYCLEIERRQKHYAEMFQSLGATVVEAQLPDLLDFNRFLEVAARLGFPASRDDASLKDRFLPLAGTRHNEKHKRAINVTPEQLAEAEEAVWDRVYHADPLLRTRIERQYQ